MQTIKSLRLFILALVVCSNIFAQTSSYKSFTQTYGSWIVEKWGPLGPGLSGIHSWKKYEAVGDTTIGSYTYKKVMVANNTGYPAWNGSTYVIPFGTSVFSFGYRNDVLNKKVYYLDITGGLNKDTLWYDFNLKVGDTIKETYSYTHDGYIVNNQRRIVSSIDSVLICGTYYKQFNFNCGGGFETSLIEGAGFKDKFDSTNFGGGCPFEPSYIYSTTYSTCNITSVDDYFKDNQIKLFPNPVSSELKIKSTLKIVEYSVFNNFGSIILKEKLPDSQSINISSLSNGIYIIKMQDKSGVIYQSKFIKQ